MPFELTPNATKGVLTFGIIIVIYIVMLLVIKIINKKVGDIKRRHTARKTTLYAATLLALAAVSVLWMENLRTISVVISVIGAGLVVALGDVFLCIAGWFLILIRRPYDAGDRIQIGEVMGDIIDIRLFQTSMLEIGNWTKEDQSTGRVVHVPNSQLFKFPVFNFTRGFEYLWDEIKITVTFESDWKKAEEIMLLHAHSEGETVSSEVSKRIKKMAERYLIFYEKLTPIVYTKIIDNGIELSLRYLTAAKARRHRRDKISRLILDDFEKEEKVNFAYPTYRIVR
jgi:small-conductance mechanosensitive channel